MLVEICLEISREDLSVERETGEETLRRIKMSQLCRECTHMCKIRGLLSAFGSLHRVPNEGEREHTT